ncbi:MAG: RT0821/Lpp0805 family surface protein [Marivibrio sp.]|uniref:RT0821/Lpp0805 family surface protein n=1 Tax=Marivibrio sp. TaxID=2039719 RepID=UPI0032EEFA5F
MTAQKTIFGKAAVLVVAAGLALAGCAQDRGTNETLGGVGGAVLGGLLGAQVGGGSGRLIATGAGAVLGGLVGSSIGRTMDEVSRQKMARTTQATLEHVADDQTSSWSNPNDNAQGTVTPVETYQRNDGRYCREFQQTVTIGGKTEEAYGTACRQPDGSWEIVNS